MQRSISWNLCAAAALLALLLPTLGLAATLREQRDELRRATTLLKAAVRLAERDRGDDATAQFTEAQEKIQEVAKELDPKLQRTYARAAEQLAETHQQLTTAGLTLPELGSTEPTMPEQPAGEGRPPRRGRFDQGDVSFVEQVAPLLAQKCGRCHVDRSQGGFSLATYNSLMRGSEGGRVLIPGEGTGGVMMDNLESGAMPPGAPLRPEEMTLISRWITQGAKFDGADPDANLKRLEAGPSPGEPMQEQPKPAASRATGNETVSFALDVAPILTDRCAECHVNDNRGQLRFAAYQQLIDASIVSPGAPAGSEMVRRIQPDAEQRMPPNGPALTAEQIQTITTWVQEGAKFDGRAPGEPLSRSTAVVRAERATPDELTTMRAALALESWRLGIPDEQAREATSERFLVVGSIPESRLEAVAAAAESLTDNMQKTLGLAPGAPLGKSKQTLYLFNQRIDYREFVLMVEKRQLGDDAVGHARFDPVEPYACLTLADDEDPSGAALAKQVAALAVAEQAGGQAPDWFVEGAARYAVAKAMPKDPLSEAWIAGLVDAAKRMTKADAFMAGGMPPEEAGVVAMHFVAGMARNGKAFHGLLEDVGGGQGFGAAFGKRYNASPRQVAEQWAASLKRRG
ncbi:Planctomycete cytochrome C [Posidoniimonas polymericola]|uniref:Planctomycete cytochrome C n=1 Tax=Posidoniimonas polymericola TaxID=2528002 RepID=A0A5C5YLU5_9BACT|nr:c-type cytochrome domain-containing protein [Posidoniimonas polymericola]TWT75933.1 Planctomycete cytochrome C [Posidoniimonas polymericola]